MKYSKVVTPRSISEMGVSISEIHASIAEIDRPARSIITSLPSKTYFHRLVFFKNKTYLATMESTPILVSARRNVAEELATPAINDAPNQLVHWDLETAALLDAIEDRDIAAPTPTLTSARPIPPSDLLLLLNMVSSSPVTPIGKSMLCVEVIDVDDYDSDCTIVTKKSTIQCKRIKFLRKHFVLTFDNFKLYFFPYLGQNSRLAMRGTSFRFSTKIAAHSFMYPHDYEVIAALSPTILNKLVVNFNRRAENAEFMIPRTKIADRWLETIPFTSSYGFNVERLGVFGLDLEFAFHGLYDFPFEERRPRDIAAYTHVSKHVTCKNCGILSCCGGVTNMMNDTVLFKCKHVRGCPLVAFMARLNGNELRSFVRYSTLPVFDMLNLHADEMTPWQHADQVEANEDLKRKKDTMIGVHLINHARYNMYFWQVEPNKFESESIVCDISPTDDDHIFMRVAIRDGCLFCINEKCQWLGRCIQPAHYTCLNRHEGVRTRSRFNS